MAVHWAQLRLVRAGESLQSSNLLLNSVGRDGFDRLQRCCNRVPLEQGQVVLKAGAPVSELCFPEGGVVSFHDVMDDGTRVGVGIIGLEGFTGWSALLGCDLSPHEATVAIGGATALSISRDALEESCGDLPELKRLLLLYVQCFVSQMGRTILSNLNDPVERRLARWLLMNHDRLEGDEIVLTHEQLGVMLGVRRATVTDALHVLEGEGLIRSVRCRIKVRDRGALMHYAGEAYGAAEQSYSRLIAPFGKAGAAMA